MRGVRLEESASGFFESGGRPGPGNRKYNLKKKDATDVVFACDLRYFQRNLT